MGLGDQGTARWAGRRFSVPLSPDRALGESHIDGDQFMRDLRDLLATDAASTARAAALVDGSPSRIVRPSPMERVVLVEHRRLVREEFAGGLDAQAGVLAASSSMADQLHRA